MLKSYIITGDQAVGKTLLGSLIASVSKSTRGAIDCIEFDADTEVVVIDELTQKDLPKWKTLITQNSIVFRPPYQASKIEIKPIIIGIFQPGVDLGEVRHSTIFKLTR